jgi:hypothetical protein
MVGLNVLWLMQYEMELNPSGIPNSATEALARPCIPTH